MVDKQRLAFVKILGSFFASIYIALQTNFRFTNFVTVQIVNINGVSISKWNDSVIYGFDIWYILVRC